MTHSAAFRAPTPFDRPPRLPTAVGPYRILSVLGEGGMGTVYLAEQPVPRREVALKVIRADLASPRLLRRFEREAEVLGRLEHPAIAQVFEAGTAELREGDDRPTWTVPYIAMARVQGVPLTDHPAARGDVRDRVQLLLQVCDAVQYAHQRGVIHRDLKPGNILVDAAGAPKVLDFGIARLSDADAQASTATGLGEVLGSLPYMSPEQVTGDPLDVDVRSDVYALGVLLYEVLAGRRPLIVDGQSFPSALRVILSDEPPRLSAVAPPAVAPAVRGDLETIVATALDKEKERRYASAQALADDLRRWLRDEPIAARPASAAYQLRKFARRNRALVGGAALAAAALLVGSGVSTWQAVRATAAERVATAQRAEALAARGQAEARGREALAAGVLAEQRRLAADSARTLAERERAAAEAARGAAEASAQIARREAAKAQAVNGFLEDMLAARDPGKAVGKTVTVREVVDEAARRVASGSLVGQPEVEAAVRATLGNTYLGTDVLDSARVQLERALAMRRAALGPKHHLVGHDLLQLGKLHSRRSDYAAASAALQQAVAILRASRDPAARESLIAALGQLGYVRYAEGRMPEAELLHREAVRVARGAPGAPGAPLGVALRGLGEFLAFTSQPAEGATILREAVAVLRKVHGSLHPWVATAQLNLTFALTTTDKRSDHLEAVRIGRETIDQMRILYPDVPGMRADAASRLATVLIKLDSLDAAEPMAREAVALRVAALGEADPNVAFARTDLGRLQMRRGRHAEAESLFTQAYRTRRAALGDRHPAVGSSMQDLGRLAYARGDTAAGLPLLVGAVERWEAAGIMHVGALDRIWVAAGALATGNLALADSMARGVTVRDTTGGVSALTVSRAHDVLGRVAAARGDSARAEREWSIAYARARAVPGADGGADAVGVAGRLAAFCARRACAVDAATWRSRAGQR